MVIRREVTGDVTPLVAASFERNAFLEASWTKGGGVIFDSVATDQRYKLGGRTKNEFIPIDLTTEPEIAAVIGSLEDDDNDTEESSSQGGAKISPRTDETPPVATGGFPHVDGGDFEVLNDDEATDSA